MGGFAIFIDDSVPDPVAYRICRTFLGGPLNSCCGLFLVWPIADARGALGSQLFVSGAEARRAVETHFQKTEVGQVASGGLGLVLIKSLPARSWSAVPRV